MSNINGGKMLLNMYLPQISTDDAWINRVKGGQTWTAFDGTTGPNHDLFVLDSNGYPTAIPGSGSGSSGLTTAFPIPSQALHPGRYYADWVGGGTIGFVGCSVVSGSALSNASTGIYRTLINVNGLLTINPVISAVGTDGSHITQLAFIHEDDIAAWDGGEKYWSTRFLASLRYLNPGRIRFLDWENQNFNNMTTWASRKPIDYISYTAAEIRPSLWAGTTTNSGNDYSSSFGSGQPTSKQQVHVKLPASASITEYIVTVSNANPAVVDFGIPCPFAANDPITLSSDGFPPQPINNASVMFVKTVTGNTCTVSFTAGGTAISTLGNSSSGSITATRPPRYRLNSGDTYKPMMSMAGAPLRPNNNNVPASGAIATFTYDAELKIWLMNGGASIDLWGGLTNYVPFELYFDLCGKIGADPWIVIPILATESSTDWATGIAGYDVGTVKPAYSWMSPLYEGPNEFWNTNGPLETLYGEQRGAFNFGIVASASVHEQYGKIMSRLGQDLQSVYGGALDGSKFKVVCGTQNASGNNPTSNDARMTSPLWVAQTSAAQTAHNWITHHCTGGYINSSTLYFGNQNVINGFNYLVTNAGNPTARMTILDSYGSDFVAQADNVVTNFAKPLFDWAKVFTNRDGFATKNCGYEGGPSDDIFFGSVSNPITAINKNATATVTVGTPTSVQGLSPWDSLANGHPFIAGMAATVGSAGGMTQINNAGMFNTLVITAGTVDIPFTGAATVGQVFWFNADEGHPTPPNLRSVSVDGNFYYVVAVNAGVSIQISRTKGGGAITPNGSGSYTVLFAQTGWKVLSVGVGTVTLDCDSSAFSTYTSGGSLFVVGGDVYLNAMRSDVRRSNTLATSMLHYFNAWTTAGGEFPPQYAFAFPTLKPGSDVIGSNLHIWGFIDSIYGADISGAAGTDPLTPYALVIHNFNAVASTITAAFSVMQDNSSYRVKMIGY